jgi:ElaB/YqjD/DUF883 family membrane-anchored ribosome-binding protein
MSSDSGTGARAGGSILPGAMVGCTARSYSFAVSALLNVRDRRESASASEENRSMVKEVETATKADQELDAIKEHVEALRTELATLTKHVKGLSSAALARAQTAGALKIEEFGVDLERAADALRRQGQASIAQVEDTIKERPLLSLLAAFGAGVLIARLLERK